MKLNRAGIVYITKMLEEFEAHANSVMRAVIDNDRPYLVLDECGFSPKAVTLGYETFWVDECEKGYVNISMEDLLSTDYAATRAKYAAERQAKIDEKKAQKEAAEAAEKNLKVLAEHRLLKTLMLKHPEIAKRFNLE